jgi:predicted Ser/Thr protein kinase
VKIEAINFKEIKGQVKKITVTNIEDQDVTVTNKSSLEMIGKGRQGAVFKINNEMCLKVYGNVEDCEREHYALSLGQKTTLIPKVYSKGKNFIVMEMVYGVDLREYLQTSPLTKELSYQLIQMLLVFKEIGFERIDHHKRQIYLQEDGSLKVIDVGRTVWRDRTYPYPRKLLQSLGNDYEAVFLEHVKEMAPELYDEWQHYIYMQEVSKKLYHHIQNKMDIDWDSLGNTTDKLLTTNNKKTYYKKLESLVRKVVKEEKEQERLKKIESKNNESKKSKSKKSKSKKSKSKNKSRKKKDK